MQIQNDNQFKQVELPENLTRFLKIKNGELKRFRNFTFSVTELTSCKRNTFYKKSKIPREEPIIPNISEMWTGVRGELLHKLAEAYSWNELEGEMQVELEYGKKITVCGRLDMYDHKTQTIIDLKTLNDVKRQANEGLLPKSEHVLQILAYYTIFSKIIPVKSLNLVYADMNDFVTFEIPIKDTSDWIQNRVRMLQNFVESGNVPDAEVSSKCKFCRYQSRCFASGTGIKETPQTRPRYKKEYFRKN